MMQHYWTCWLHPEHMMNANPQNGRWFIFVEYGNQGYRTKPLDYEDAIQELRRLQHEHFSTCPDCASLFSPTPVPS